MLHDVGFVQWNSGLYKTYLMHNSLSCLPFWCCKWSSSTSLLSRFWNFMSRFRLWVSKIRFFVSKFRCVSRIFFRVWRRIGLNSCQLWTFIVVSPCLPELALIWHHCQRCSSHNKEEDRTTSGVLCKCHREEKYFGEKVLSYQSSYRQFHKAIAHNIRLSYLYRFWSGLAISMQLSMIRNEYF
jgi:hypothetical protein